LRILGIDPGTSATGVGVVELLGDGARLLHAGTLSPPRRKALPLRLSFLYDELARVIETWGPVEVAIEQPFVARNVKSAFAVGQAQGVAMAAAGKAGLEIFGYEPRKVKQSITGHGGSTKNQVQIMVCASLGIDGLGDFTTDASDALAVALCHLSARRVSRLAVKD
jgi:crossover junction endodeoxyribonuclease RuvC